MKKKKKKKNLIQIIRIYSQGIGMKFEIENCAMLLVKSGKRQITEGIQQQNQCYVVIEAKILIPL